MSKQQKPSTPPSLLIKLCSEKTAFEVKIQQRLRFNMGEVEKTFEAKSGYKITVHTPYILVFKNPNGVEVTLTKSGRMLIKGVAGEEEAKAVAQEVLQTASKCARADS